MKILLAVYGSYGHYAPFVSLGLALKQSGHEVLLVTQEDSAQEISKYGIDAVGIMPFFDDPTFTETKTDDEIFWYLVNRFMVGSLEEKYISKLEGLLDGVDVIIRDPQFPAAALLAEKYNILRIDYIVSGHFFGQDTEMYQNKNYLWLEQTNECRKMLGLPSTDNIPYNLFCDNNLKIIAYPKFFTGNRKNYDSENVIYTNFPIILNDSDVPDEIENFLNSGTPPIVFALGVGENFAYAMNIYEDIYEISDKTRILVLTNKNIESKHPNVLFYTGVTPHNKIFPRCSLIIHHGGLGTIGNCLRSNIPQIGIPVLKENILCCEIMSDLFPHIKQEDYTKESLFRYIEDPEYNKELGNHYSQIVKNNDGSSIAVKVIEDKYLNGQCSTFS